MPTNQRNELYCRTNVTPRSPVEVYRRITHAQQLEGHREILWRVGTLTGIYDEYVKSVTGVGAVLLMVHLPCNYRL